MRRFLLASGLLAGVICSAGAEEAGRYQAIDLRGAGVNAPGNRVLILDTKDGHLWMWSEAQTPDGRGPITYQGKVESAESLGDVAGPEPAPPQTSTEDQPVIEWQRNLNQ